MAVLGRTDAARRWEKKIAMWYEDDGHDKGIDRQRDEERVACFAGQGLSYGAEPPPLPARWASVFLRPEGTSTTQSPSHRGGGGRGV